MTLKVVAGVVLALTPMAVLAADMTDLKLASGCTTSAISVTGKGYSCQDDNASCQTAPEKYVIAQNTVSAHATSWNGALAGNLEKSCPITYSDYVEVIPGSQITQPKTICVQAVAQSGSGATRAGKRGWSKCTVTGKMTKYQ